MNFGIEFFFMIFFVGVGEGGGLQQGLIKKNWMFGILESFMNDFIIAGLHQSPMYESSLGH